MQLYMVQSQLAMNRYPQDLDMVKILRNFVASIRKVEKINQIGTKLLGKTRFLFLF